MNKEYILKVGFTVGLLFILFLWSGGVYEYSSWKIRHNKITGASQYLSDRNYGWVPLESAR